MMDSVLLWIATGFGLGSSPWLPGTVGALPGIPIVLLAARLSLLKQLLLALMLCVFSGVICGLVQARIATHDPRQIVADEYLTFPVATIGLPVAKHPVLLATVFVASRLLDGVKPPPARWAERLPGGAGIVLDDVVSNLYALACGSALYLLFFRRRQADDSARKGE